MHKRLAYTVFATLIACVLGLAAFGRASLASDAASTSSSTLRVSVIDVGKGDCILVRAGDSCALIDAGYEKTAADVLGYLEGQSVKRLDALVLTHYDRDHVGGVGKMGRGVDIGTVYLPAYVGSDENYRSCVAAVRGLGVPTKSVKEEVAFDLGGAHLTILPSGVPYVPGAGGDEGNDNDASLVVTVANGRDSYLFAGDLEEEGVDAFLKAKRGKFDVIKMPHHGRRSSNTADLLEEVRPQIAVITDSSKDPAEKKVLKLLKQSGVDVYRTSSDGTIVIESKGAGKYAVSTSD